MFQTIKNAIKNPDLRKKLLYTLLLIVIFRLGCYITVPGVDSIALADALGAQNGLTGLIDLISGGAFSRFSMFAMSISPYITASIVIQLLAMVIPALERLSKEEGEAGRQKLNKYTKVLTLVLALVESLGIYLSYRSAGVFVDDSFLTGALIVISLVAGTSLLMWLGDQITNKGIGNRNICNNFCWYPFRTSKWNYYNMESNVYISRIFNNRFNYSTWNFSWCNNTCCCCCICTTS